MTNAEITGYKRLLVAIIYQKTRDFTRGNIDRKAFKDFCLYYELFDYIGINGERYYNHVIEKWSRTHNG